MNRELVERRKALRKEIDAHLNELERGIEEVCAIINERDKLKAENNALKLALCELNAKLESSD